jgi:hypothetical protein
MGTVELVLFWPALFFIKGDGADAAEVARIQGEMQPIEQLNRMKNCNIVFAASLFGGLGYGLRTALIRTSIKCRLNW